MWLNFTITLALFPGIPAIIPLNYYVKTNKNDNGWYAVGIQTIFIVMDYVGRQTPKIKWFRKLLSINGVLILSLTRLVYGTLFPLEAYPRYSSRTKGPFIRCDELSCLIMILFGFSNGYVATMAMSQFIETVEDP